MLMHIQIVKITYNWNQERAMNIRNLLGRVVHQHVESVGQKVEL